MKHNLRINLMIIAAVILITATPAFCAPLTLKQTAVKFLFVMCGIAISSLVIYVGLTIYNNLFILPKTGVKSDEIKPKQLNNIDDAVDFFIKKNKLR